MTGLKLLSIIAILNVGCGKSEFFEGKVNYAVKVSVRNPELDSNIVKQMYGKTSTVYYKDGQIKFESDNGVASIYTATENRNYYLYRPDSVYWINAETLTEKILSISNMENSESVSGISCKVLFIETEPTEPYKKKVGSFSHRKRYYYYSDKYSINYSLFQKCNYNNFNKVYSEIKVVPLKIIEDYNGLLTTYEMTSIQEETLSSDIFKINSKLPQREIR